MKIILSRKGFDSGSGGIPSPVLPDGTLLSLPIPSKSGSTAYRDIEYNGKSYFEIIKELSPKTAKRLEGSKCHVDPDLKYTYVKYMPSWRPAFGQHGQSLKHLQNHAVGAGDIFLFYGWFRKTKIKDGRIQYIERINDNTPDRHIIYGYMEIGEEIKDIKRIKENFPWHPHALEQYTDKNALFLPCDTLSFDASMKGFGLLKYSQNRQLTLPLHKRSEWLLPEFLKEAKISYNDNDKYGFDKSENIFRAACRGQEFVIESDDTENMKKWIMDILKG